MDNGEREGWTAGGGVGVDGGEGTVGRQKREGAGRLATRCVMRGV